MRMGQSGQPECGTSADPMNESPVRARDELLDATRRSSDGVAREMFEQLVADDPDADSRWIVGQGGRGIAVSSL